VEMMLKAFFLILHLYLRAQLSRLAINQFQNQDNNLSLVVDEYGEIQGLLTMEDIFT